MLFGLQYRVRPLGEKVVGSTVSNYCNTATLGDDRRVTERYTHTSVHTLSGHYLGYVTLAR